jgi:hypothetical protein
MNYSMISRSLGVISSLESATFDGNGQTEEYWSGIYYTYQCSCQCYFYHPLRGDRGMDWGVCTNPKSPRAGLLTFEHMGCAFYASPYHSGRNPTYYFPRDPLPEGSKEGGKP